MNNQRYLCTTRILVFLVLLIFPAALAADTTRIEALARWMKQTHRWADDMTLVEMGESGELTMIRRGDGIVGYYYLEHKWEPKDLTEVDLTGITKVTFGTRGLQADRDPLTIVITEPTEVHLWVAAYKNHTQHQRIHAMLVPLGDDAGFKPSLEEVDYGGCCLCDLGVRYYAGEKEVHMVKGHFRVSGDIDLRTKNEMLHLLVKAKFPKAELPEKADEAQVEPDPAPDPFAPEKTDTE